MNSKIVIWCLVLLILFVFLCSLYSFTREPLDIKTPSPDPSNNTLKYKNDNYDVEYHDPVDKSADAISKGTWVKDVSGNLVFVPWVDKLSNKATYYTSGAYPYSASTYVPNYEDSVYLSRSTGQSTVGVAYPTSASFGGICNQDTGIDNKAKMEQSCNVLTNDVCASTTCCVLLGGSKCVSGSERGPYMSANYSDPFIINKDFYFYQGKCYGKCL